MANRTVKDAQSVKGTNPQYLVEKITRTRIYESKFWKEQCFALSAELLVDKAMKLRYVGGVYGGNVKPTPFLCLLLKMLQIQPQKDIVIYFITQQDYKYTRALGALYLRLTGNSTDCYKYLEPLLLDYRKIRLMNKAGEFELSHMDEYIDGLLHEERACDIILPRIQKRHVLEESNMLEARVSVLENDLDDMDTSDEEEDTEMKNVSDHYVPGSDKRSGHTDWDRARRSPSPRYRRSPSPHRIREPHRDWQPRDDYHYGGAHQREAHRHRGEQDHPRRRSRSRERHRHRGDKERDRDKKRSHKHREEDDRHHHHHKSKKSKRSDRDMSREELEIKQANEERARLGLAPLRM